VPDPELEPELWSAEVSRSEFEQVPAESGLERELELALGLVQLDSGLEPELERERELVQVASEPDLGA
jgi:hypothetical protein